MQVARSAVQVCFGGMQRDLLLYRYKGLAYSARGDAATAPLPETASDFDRRASLTATAECMCDMCQRVQNRPPERFVMDLRLSHVRRRAKRAAACRPGLNRSYLNSSALT